MSKPKEIGICKAKPIKFSFCTLLTNKEEYEDFYKSCLRKGFGEEDCEFLFFDNTSKNNFDGFQGFNISLQVAKGEFVIFCHQDIQLIDGRKKLENCLDELTQKDPDWALAGNAGGVNLKKLALRISDPHGKDQCSGELPEKVKSLDENFIVVRTNKRVAVSGDLKGFHLYGTDICILADILGYSSWVIDFHVCHKSPGNVGHKNEENTEGFYVCKERLIRKYTHALRSRYLRTTCTKLALSGSPMVSYFLNTSRVKRFFSKLGC